MVDLVRRALLVASLAATALLLASAPAPAAIPRLPGIDVSRFQGQIDWESVAADGIRFAFVQASRGSGRDCTVASSECGADGFYDFNHLEAKAAGVRVGAYHRAFVGGRGLRGVTADAKAEARTFITAVGEPGPRDLRPALDLEAPFADLSPTELRIWARTWLQAVRRAFAVKPIIYTSPTSWTALGNRASFARKGHALWIAHWGVPKPNVPADNWGGRSWRVWQHTSDGRIDGITGRVDLDWLRGGWHGLSIG